MGANKAVSILLGTDAASEGLNLQQFSAPINYDLPWNPMRVEQRIGRIDLIGQPASEVLILNLYVRNTIEEDTYVTLRTRIRLFEEVVDPLQPILGAMPRVLRKVAMGEMELAEARRQLDEAALQKPDPAAAALDNPIPTDAPDTEQTIAPPAPPQRQEELAAWCLAHPAPGMRVIVAPEPGRDMPLAQRTRACLSILWSRAPAHLGIGPMEEILATFDGELADRHPPMALAQDEEGRARPGKEGVRLLTWGDPYLTAWLEAVRGEGPLPAEG